MSDENPNPKKAWARCPACSTVYPNIQIAKDGHKLNCPHDLNLKLDRALDRIKKLEGLLEENDVAEPGVDFFGVDDDEQVVEDEQYDDVEEPAIESGLITDGWDDDEDSLASRPTGPVPVL